METKLLWKPSAANIANSQMQRFIEYVNNQHHLQLTNYQELYNWSIQNPKLFWPAMWEFAQVKCSKKWDTVLSNENQMPGAKWFTGAKLNFAENLLSRNDDQLAIIFSNELGQRRTLTYHQLITQVASLAAHLKKLGVTIGDRVVGILPNFPETVIAMLAATSLGAIWSSCSPDFGDQALIDRFSQITPKILFTVDGYYYNGKEFNIIPKISALQEKLPSLQQTILIPYLSQKTNVSSLKNVCLYQKTQEQLETQLNFEQLPFEHPVYILYSSGTTGIPKCIVHSAGGTLLQHLKELILHTNLSNKDRFMYYTTCGWMMWNWFVSGLATGATIVLYEGSTFHPKHSVLFDLIDAEKITVFGTSAKYLSAAEKFGLTPKTTHSLASLRTILSTGSPLLPESFDYVYEKIKTDLCLSSISGGTDIVSCFALGNPILPVYRGELQCIGLGLNVKIFNEQGQAVREQKGELVCTASFPAMPVYFWNDIDGSKYYQAYFAKYPHIWAHGDYAEITTHNGMIIYGRSDAILNPGGVRIGTSEIYQQVEHFPEVLESIAVGQEWQDDVRIILFVKLQPDITLSDELKKEIKDRIRTHVSPRHVPAKIIQIADIPKTINGKIVELAVREVIHNRPVKNASVLANPEALEFYKNITELGE